jgi:hypothetical protein
LGGKSIRAPLFQPQTLLWILGHVVIIALGLICLLFERTIWDAIGTSLIATGGAGLCIAFYTLRTEHVQLGLDNLTTFGIQRIFTGRSARIRSEYEDRLDSMRQSLDVLGFGLSALLQDFREELPNWKRRANVRILVLDPNFPTAERPYALQRDAEEQNEAGRIANDVQNVINQVKDLVGVGDNGKTFHVRMYTCLPAVNIFRVDDELFWGPYLMHLPSRNTPTLLVRRGGILFETMTRHFDEIWQDPDLSHPI